VTQIKMTFDIGVPTLGNMETIWAFMTRVARNLGGDVVEWGGRDGEGLDKVWALLEVCPAADALFEVNRRAFELTAMSGCWREQKAIKVFAPGFTREWSEAEKRQAMARISREWYL
jgi:hypothetical protein